MKREYHIRGAIIRTSFILLAISIPIKSQDPEQSLININNITSWIRNDGYHPSDMVSESWNGAFPKDIPAGVIYSEGLVWGGKVLDGGEPLIRVNGSTYFNGNVPVTRLFRVRTHFKIEDLRDDASGFFRVPIIQVSDTQIEKIYSQYEKDWNEWPAEKGAPFYDQNKNGIYEPETDIPGVPGSSQTIWIHYNDSESPQSYGSPPIGVEVQETYWAYTYTDIENVIYKQAKIIYKGTETSAPDSYIDSMYIVQWVDTDLGNWTDDFLGCDTLLNLGYTYNSKTTDNIYSQFLPAPPAAGFVFLQGVAQQTGNPSDSAVVNFKWRKRYNYFHHKPMTIFLAKRTAGGWSDPDGQDPEGTLQFYNLMRGYLPRPPYPISGTFIRAVGKELGGFGTYNLPGDPVSGTGWIDGIYEGPGDRRMFLITGPFGLTKNDTAEVVLALVGAYGNSHLGNITLLKYDTKVAVFAYDIFVDQITSGNVELPPPQVPPEPEVPDNYVLYQNYPNPFNASTIIKYDLPEPAYVELVVYDVLGSEVRKLIDEEKSAGSYSVEFSSQSLSSGVYFYKISFNNLSNKLVFNNLTKTKKLIIVK